MNWPTFEEYFVLYMFNKITVRPDGKILKFFLWTTSKNSRPYRDRDSLRPMSVVVKGPIQPHIGCVLEEYFPVTGQHLKLTRYVHSLSRLRMPGSYLHFPYAYTPKHRSVLLLYNQLYKLKTRNCYLNDAVSS